MRALSAAIALALLLSACVGGPPAFAPTTDTLDADWLDLTAEIDHARFDRMLGLLSRDSLSRSLIDDAVRRLGRGDVEELRRRFYVCGPNDAVGLGGKTFMRRETFYVARGDGYDALVAAKMTGPELLDARMVAGPDYAQIDRWVFPTICLQPGLTMREAAEAFVHELTHALHRDPRVVAYDVASPLDEATYQMGVVQLPGDEVDAYVAATQFRIRLEGSRARIVSPLQPLLDDAGQPIVSRADFSRAVLAPAPAGLGYGDGMLRGALARARADEARELATKRDVLSRYADFRHQEQAVLAKNVDILSSNLAIHDHNVEVARQRRDDAMTQQFLAKKASDQKLLEETRSRAITSTNAEARVRTELAALDARVAALGGR